jgi:hypothetical protein
MRAKLLLRIASPALRQLPGMQPIIGRKWASLSDTVLRKYDSGAVGSFTHTVALQGTNYSCEFEVFADGYSLKSATLLGMKDNGLKLCYRLINPYVMPVLHVRKPGDDLERTYNFPDDDPFFSEVSNLIDVIEDIEEDTEASQILSTYDGQLCHCAAVVWSRLISDRCCTDIRAHLGYSRGE